jgi:hypothetical protein
MGGDDNDVNGDSATGNEVDDDGEGKTGGDNDNGDNDNATTTATAGVTAQWEAAA